MFSDWKQVIQQTAVKLAACPDSRQDVHTAPADGQTFCIVCTALQHIAEYSHVYDEHVSQDTPFAEEFFALICKDCLDYDGCYAMLEDLTIFFREKTLRLHQVPIDSSEKHVLDYFETSGDWHYGDGLLVSDWYWVHIPARVFHPFLSGKAH